VAGLALIFIIGTVRPINLGVTQAPDVAFVLALQPTPHQYSSS